MYLSNSFDGDKRHMVYRFSYCRLVKFLIDLHRYSYISCITVDKLAKIEYNHSIK